MSQSITWRVLDAQVRRAQYVADALWRARHDGSDFSIIGDNCWGGFVYRHLRRPYLTPMAGLFLRFLSTPYERKLFFTNRSDLSGDGIVRLGGRGAPTVWQGIWEYRRRMDVPAWLCGGHARGGAGLGGASRCADALTVAAAERLERARIRAGGAPERSPGESLDGERDGGRTPA